MAQPTHTSINPSTDSLVIFEPFEAPGGRYPETLAFGDQDTVEERLSAILFELNRAATLLRAFKFGQMEALIGGLNDDINGFRVFRQSGSPNVETARYGDIWLQPDVDGIITPRVFNGIGFVEDLYAVDAILLPIEARLQALESEQAAAFQDVVDALRTELVADATTAADTFEKVEGLIDALTAALAGKRDAGSIPASDITGVLDPARIPPSVRAMPQVSSGGVADLTSEQQGLVGEGSPVLLADGRVLYYKGTGSKTSEASYVIGADQTPAAEQIPSLPISKTTGLQDALDSKINASARGAVDGVASLDSTGKVPSAQIPAPALVNMPFEGERSLEYFGLNSSESALNLARMQDAFDYGKPLIAEPYKLYPWEGRLVMPQGLRLRGCNAVFKPFYAAASGDTANSRYALRSTVASLGTTYTCSYTAGTRVIELGSSPSDLAVGDTLGFFSDTYNGRWPISYRLITAISDTTITLDKAMVWDMRMNQVFDPADPTNSAGLTGAVTCRKIPFSGTLSITDATFDLSGITDGTAEADGFLRALSQDSVELERLRLIGLNIDPTSTDYLLNTDYCREVRLRSLRAPNCRKNGSFISATRSALFVAQDVQWSGRGFGLAPVNCDNFFIHQIEAAGDNGNPIGGPDVSVRAIRPIGCLRGFIGAVQITDYDSGVKLEDCANIVTMGLETERVRTSWNVSSQNPGWRDGGHVLNGFNFKDYRAYGISIGGSGTGGGKVRDCMISNGSIETTDSGASEAIIQWGSIAHFNNVSIPQWPSGKAPFATVTADGILSRGTLSNFSAIAPITTGRLGIKIITTHVGYVIDPDTVKCNAPAGPFSELPPRFHAKMNGTEPRVLVSDAVSVVHTGNTSDTTLKSKTLPGGCLGPNGFLRIRAGFKWTNNANNKIIRVRVGGGVYMSSTVTTSLTRHWEGIIFNRNSESAQVGPATIAAGQGDSSGVANTHTTNTAADFVVSLTGELANAADEVGVDYWSVEAVYAP